MPDLLVDLGGNTLVRGTMVRDGRKHVHGQNLGSVKGSSCGQEVFSVLDFIAVVCKIQRKYARTLWVPLKTALEAEGLVWQAPFRTETGAHQPREFVRTQAGPGMTRAGLQRLRVLLDSKVKLHDGVVTRFLEGENTMLIRCPL